jgi:hypothetical protein
MNHLLLFTGQEPAAVGQLPSDPGLATPPAWIVFLGALVLLMAGLWWCHEYMRGLRAAHLPLWRAYQAAEQRAEQLLRQNLIDRQYQHLLDTGYLEVPSRLCPGRIYRLPARPGRVEVYEAGKWAGQLCIIACDPVPHADMILAQKWMIEADEQAFLATANWINGPSRQYAICGRDFRSQQPL